MTLSDPAVLLAAWEDAAGAPEPCRGAVVVARAEGLPVEEALDLPLGELARRALAVHAALFGPALVGVAGCTACGEVLEVDSPLPVDDAPPPSTARVVDGDREWVVRAPTTRDLLAAARSADPVRELLRSACRAADDAGLPDGDALRAVDSAAERLAGLGAATLVLTCPACDAQVRAPLDPADFLWVRVREAATSLLDEVATLASAYGWSEPEVLALSPVRRWAYVELACR